MGDFTGSRKSKEETEDRPDETCDFLPTEPGDVFEEIEISEELEAENETEVEVEIEANEVSEEIEPPISHLDDDDWSRGWNLTQSQQSQAALLELSSHLMRDPDNAQLTLVASLCYQRNGDFEAARDMLRDLLDKHPDYLPARQYYANSLMNLGDWSEGLFELEKARGRLTPIQKLFCEDISRLWTGQDLAGKHIVIVGNSHKSDEIQFSRFVTEMAKLHPKRIGFVCDGEMVELMRTLPEINRVDSDIFEPFDYFIPVESLPLRLEVRPESIPTAPYLFSRPDRVEAKKNAISGIKPLLGICWRNPQPEGYDHADRFYHSRADSVGLNDLAPILTQLSTRYEIVSLQPDLRLDEREMLSHCDFRSPETCEFDDFAKVAELISALDVVVSVDSPVAHLAGALGIDSHILLPYIAGWKWEVEDNRSSWYPSARIYGKSQENDWSGALAELMQALDHGESLAKAS